MKNYLQKFVVLFLIASSFVFVSSAENDAWDLPLNSNSEKAVHLFQQGLQAMSDVDIAKATQLFTDAVETDPNFFMPNYMLAVSYLYFNNLDKFNANAKKALAAKKLPQEEKIMQEALQKLMDDPKSDVTEYGKKLVQLHPKSVAARQILVTYQLFAGKNEDAVQTYLAMLGLTENDAPVYNMLGYAYMQLDKMNKAKEAFEMYIKLAPQNPNVYDSMGDYYMAVKDYQNAYKNFMKAHRINEAWSYNKALKAKEMMEKEPATKNNIPYSAEEIFEKSIQFHDPRGKWENYSGKLKMNVCFTNDGNTYGSEIVEIDVPNDFYKWTRLINGFKIVKGKKDGEIFFSVNGNSNPTGFERKTFAINETNINMMKELHYWHFGQFNYLRNAGVKLQEDVKKEIFDGKECFLLSFTGDSSEVINPYFIGENIFCVDSKTFEIVGCIYSDGYLKIQGKIDINGLKIPAVETWYDKETNQLRGTTLFSKGNDGNRMPKNFRVASTVTANNTGLKSTHLLKIENEEALIKLEQPLKEINEALAEMGYPECGYAIYKVNDDYKSDYTHIMEGWWICKEVYDETHNHPKYKETFEKYRDLFVAALDGQEYFRVEKLMPKLY